MYLPVAALFRIQVRGFSDADAGLALGIGAGVGLLFPVLAGTLVDRVGPRRPVCSLSLPTRLKPEPNPSASDG